jgi:hypothetical protein
MVLTYTYPAPPRRRPKRWPWVLLGVVVVLIGLLVAADRFALAYAEDRAATSLQESQSLSSKPDVDVAGFPFLTQFAASKYDKVTITADDVEVGTSRSLSIDKVAVQLHDVTTTRNLSVIRAKTAQADARIAYAELSRTLGVPVRAGSNGRLVAEPSVTIAGQRFSAPVSAVVHASSADGISFDDTKVLGVSIPDFAAQALARVFNDHISLDRLPFHVDVTGIDVTPDGLVLHLSGHDLVYER